MEQAFEAWRAQSPKHRHAYARCVAIWDAVGQLTREDIAEFKRQKRRS
jgi:ferric-dicitrate binding protein FerR (iron transport regulator)